MSGRRISFNRRGSGSNSEVTQESENKQPVQIQPDNGLIRNEAPPPAQPSSQPASPPPAPVVPATVTAKPSPTVKQAEPSTTSQRQSPSSIVKAQATPTILADSKPSNGGSDNVKIIAPVIITVLLLIFGIAAFLIHRKRQRRNRAELFFGSSIKQDKEFPPSPWKVIDRSKSTVRSPSFDRLQAPPRAINKSLASVYSEMASSYDQDSDDERSAYSATLNRQSIAYQPDTFELPMLAKQPQSLPVERFNGARLSM